MIFNVQISTNLESNIMVRGMMKRKLNMDVYI